VELSPAVLRSQIIYGMPNLILQLLDTPYVLTPEIYENAYSPANPDGDFKAAYALAELVDPVPQLSSTYVNSGSSTELNYGLVVGSASTRAMDSLVSNLIATAQESFSQAALVNIDGTPGTWRAVTAEPGNWMKPNVEGYRDATINSKTMQVTGLSRDYRKIENRSLKSQWKIQVGKQQKTLSNGSSVSNLKLKLLEVSILRNWLDMTLFQTSGWILDGQKKGYVSSGTIINNDGILPLIPTTFIVGHSVSLTMKLDAADSNFAASAGAEDVFLGPIPLENADLQKAMTGAPIQKPVNADTNVPVPLYLVGFISALVPLSPTADG